MTHANDSSDGEQVFKVHGDLAFARLFEARALQVPGVSRSEWVGGVLHIFHDGTALEALDKLFEALPHPVTH